MRRESHTSAYQHKTIWYTEQMQNIKKLLPFLCVGVILKPKEKENFTDCKHGQMNSEKKGINTYLQEESIARSNLILNGNNGVREGEDTSGDAL